LSTIAPEHVAAFERCIGAGGVALFPADTVYGLAADPDSREGVERLYGIKGRPQDRPAAVMFFRFDAALGALPDLPEPTRMAAEQLLPGPLTLLLPNPRRRFPLACGPAPEVLGLRVPRLQGPLAPLEAVRRPVLQSSANLTGGPEATRVEDVDERVRTAVDLVVDGGELPGTASTVVDLTRFDEDGSYEVVREGAAPREPLAAVLRSIR
jgi:L-threonylcarbamoyladenylate synthase